MSLVETIRGGPHAYFDSAITLLFFLLIGRYLDQRARGSARSAAERLLALNAAAVSLVLPDGTTRSVRPEQLEAGQEILVATGERVGADGTVGSGAGELDTALITGETVPQRVGPGERVFAGTINLGAPLRIRVRAVGEGTLLAEIVRLMELAEQRRSRFVAIADRVARAYAPVVHSLALLTFLGWTLSGAAPWQTALLYAIAVLIITCPCALGLAVPAVQVLASGRLMRRGTLLKSATALERFAQADMVVFDKTGTLTEGRLALLPGPAEADLLAAAGMAARLAPSAGPGAGGSGAAGQGRDRRRGSAGLRASSWRRPSGEWRLGRRDWAAGVAEDDAVGAELWLARPGVGAGPVRLRRCAAPGCGRGGGRAAAARLRGGPAVRRSAADRRPCGGRARDHRLAGRLPAGRQDGRLEALAAAGRKVLMVGDGLNDAPALAAAYVSLSPATAVDIAQTAADAVFQGARLAPVLEVIDVARQAERLVKQNFALSFGYNILAVPFAILGYVTPLIAALAMSSSSILVVLNSMRLAWRRRSAG